jgi:hypothetical protein
VGCCKKPFARQIEEDSIVKIIDVEQGSPAFFQARLGIPTASNFHQIITPAKGLYSKQAVKYAYRLIAERLLNAPMTSEVETEWMTRGKEMEATAASAYEWSNEVETVKVGFIVNDAGTAGASPDRLIKGKPVGLEIKCPSPHVHVGYLLGGIGDDYRVQVQGQIFIAELDEAHLFSYHDRMPAATVRTPRDEEFIKKLASALDQFNADMFAMLERARSLGVFQSFEEAVTPTDVERAADLDRQFREDFGLPAPGEPM